MIVMRMACFVISTKDTIFAEGCGWTFSSKQDPLTAGIKKLMRVERMKRG